MSDNSTFPGVFIEEVPAGVHPIEGVSTSETGFVDFFARGPLDRATRLGSFAEFEQVFGGLDPRSEASYAVQQYFLNGGNVAWVVRVAAAHEPQSSEWRDAEGAAAILGRGGEANGIYALRGTGFNILCLPAAANLSAEDLKTVINEAAMFCNEERAFLIVDIPPAIDMPQKAIDWLDPANPAAISRDRSAAVYFPRVLVPDPLNQKRPRNCGASGTMAGVYARTDATHGVWKAPAGRAADLRGVDLVAQITDADNGKLNVLAINSLRRFPTTGNVCWGARTLEGTDQLGSEWKYIPVRRTALFIESSIHRGIQWALFAPNNESLWSLIRLNIAMFMQGLFRQGALLGATPREAYFVQCDSSTTTQDDIDQGVVNITVGFALVRPAEFIILNIQQPAGQTAE